MAESAEPKIPLASGAMMLLSALVVDGLQGGLDLIYVGLILDPFLVTPVFLGVLWIWFGHYGISLFSGPRASSTWTTLVVEATPGFDIMPGFSGFIIYMLVKDRFPSITRAILSNFF